MKKLSIIFLSILALGCNKKNNTSQITTAGKNATLVERLIGECEAGNSNNRYDEAGIQHNLCLAYIDSIIIANHDSSEHSIIAAANTYGQAHMSQYVVMGPTTESLLASVVSNAGQGMTNAIANLPCSTPVKNYLLAFNARVRQYTDYTDSGHISYCDAKSKIMAIETQVMNDQTLTAHDQQLLLGCFSVARYSLNANWPSGSNPNNPPPTVSYLLITYSTWVAIADAIGYVCGDCGTNGDFMASACSEYFKATGHFCYCGN